MKRLLFTIPAAVLMSIAAHGATPLGGFYYGQAEAPAGHEWQSPDSLAYNKELPRATFSPFKSVENARRVLPDYSEYTMSLDGTWKFHWVKRPELRPADFYRNDYDTSSWDDLNVPSSWNIAGLQPDGSQKYGTPIYVNQKVIFQHKVAEGDWKGGVMRTPPENWTTNDARNEVGSYKRSFTLPKDWDGREVYINFDGVDSFFYLWINGQYVGFSKNSRNAARFDITRYLQPGQNTVAVEVYRNSDGSFLEAQDMFRLPGIFRSVSLYSTPKMQIRDLVVIPDLVQRAAKGKTPAGIDGVLNITADLRNLGTKQYNDLKMVYTLYANKLYDDTNTPVKGGKVASGSVNVSPGGEVGMRTVQLKVSDPNLWNAETPYRYTLVAQLVDKSGKAIETVSTYTGFRKVEILDTKADDDEFGKAGRYYYLNGKPIKFKGVNRHETSPADGHAISRQQMEREVMLMKQANINHVRGCHYPDAPYWYYLADKYGIMLEDECNIESHQYYYGKASLSHVPEFENAHVARNMEMVHSTVNSPAVVIWSLGNEAGPGKNFESAYNAIKAFDTSRPVQYERNNDIVDMGSNQYPSIDWVREAASGQMDDIKYPFHISEYAHSMGNALGGLVDYWKAIESTNYVMGGAIWDWVDQSMYAYDPKTGERYLAFGGDFGDTPTDGQFVMNGIMFGDLTPKPQYYEVKKVYQNVGITAPRLSSGEFEIFNKQYFTLLQGYDIVCTLLEDGKPVASGKAVKATAEAHGPRTKATYRLPFAVDQLKPGSEYFVNVDLVLTQDTPWANAGYVQMYEQLPLQTALPVANAAANNGKALTVKTADKAVKVEGDGVAATFDLSTGALTGLAYGGRQMIAPEQGLQLDAFRAYVNNDNWVIGGWMRNGLYNLQHRLLNYDAKVDANGNAVVTTVVESQAPRGGKMVGGNGNARGTYTIDESKSKDFTADDFKFTTRYVWSVRPDGTVDCEADIESNNPELILPRLGFAMQTPKALNDYTYYGRGPVENYSDRKTGQRVGIYSAPVDSMYTAYTRPQNNGNREDVRWVTLVDGDGKGFKVSGPQTFSATVSPYTEMQLFLTDHTYKLPQTQTNTLHIDLGMTGLGGYSCGQGGPLDHQRVLATPHHFKFTIQPVK